MSDRLQFFEQIEAYRLRHANLVPTRAWDDMMHNAHDRGFTVAGALKAGLLRDLAAAVDRAITEGTGLEAFREDFRAAAKAHGWSGWTGEGTKAGEAWRTRVIYRTNMRTSYMTGRRAQLIKGGYKWWVYRHGGSVEPRLHHLALDGIALPPDHPFWQTHYPPNGWGCSCTVFGARSAAGIRRVGGDPYKVLPEGWDKIDPRTGAPQGIDKGWGYSVGAEAAPEIASAKAVPAQIAQPMEAETGLQADDGRAMQALLGQLIGQSFVNQLADAARDIDEPRLSAGQKMVLRAYTGQALFRLINRELREQAAGKDLSGEILTTARALDHALSRLPRFRGSVWRGYAEPVTSVLRRFQGLQPGDRISINGFVSSASERAQAFEGPVQLRIESRSGRAIHRLSEFPGELEVLMPRGLQYEVTDTIYEGGTLVVHLRELAPSEFTKVVTEAFSMRDEIVTQTLTSQALHLRGPEVRARWSQHHGIDVTAADARYLKMLARRNAAQTPEAQDALLDAWIEQEEALVLAAGVSESDPALAKLRRAWKAFD